MNKLYCTYCGSRNHNENYCPKTWGGQGNRNNLKCSYCGSNKHDYDSCPKINNSGDNFIKEN